MNDWDDTIPIYLQLRSTVLQRILSGSLAEGEAVPSVHQVAADEKINPLTVSKAYQMLVEEELLEKRRGLGMFVQVGAQAKALQQERQTFLSHEWPRVQARIAHLGFDVRNLLEGERE
jgi:GntR family transcriptional regulator